MKTIAGQCQKSRNMILVFQQEECGQVYRTPQTDQHYKYDFIVRIESFQDIISHLEQRSLCRMMLPICQLKTGKKAVLSNIVSYFTQEGDVCNWSMTWKRITFKFNILQPRVNIVGNIAWVRDPPTMSPNTGKTESILSLTSKVGIGSRKHNLLESEVNTSCLTTVSEGASKP